MKMDSSEGMSKILNAKESLRRNMKHKIKELPEFLQPLLSRCIVTGGAIPALINNDTVNDYDLLFQFAPDLSSFMQWVSVNQASDHIADITKYDDFDDSTNQKYYTTSDGVTKAVSKWAVTFGNKIQVVMAPITYRLSFDFIHCMPYYDITKHKLFISNKQFDSIIQKKIIVNNPETLTQKRVDKYKSRGWSYDQE